VAAWTTPAVLALVAAQVCAGGVDAPALVLATLVAPLAALLRGRGEAPEPPSVVTAAVCAVSVGLVLAANLLLFAELGVLAGFARWQGAVLVGAITLLVTLRPARDRWRGALLPLGLGLVLLPLAGVATSVGIPPWTAWRDGASRPALRLRERSTWVTSGVRLERPTALLFTEEHRLTAMSPAVYRVTERDGERVVVREWRLVAGESLAVRPGDRVEVEAGARVRFEAGKRAPGTAASGVVWADPPERGDARRLPSVLGLLATLVGGALALVGSPAARRGARLRAPLLGMTFVVGGACWGLYAAALAPELSAAGAAAAPLVGLPTIVLGARGAAGAAVAVIGLLVVFLAGAFALRDRVAAATGGRALGAWTAITALAVALAFWPAPPWRVLALGLGLAASAWAAPSLALGGTSTGGPAAAGSLIGAVAFAALGTLGPRLPAWAAPLGTYPVLLAAPLAFAAAALGETLRRPPAGWQ
jgi:hypothetical protein